MKKTFTVPCDRTIGSRVPSLTKKFFSVNLARCP
jgi:hypothetical protein